MLREVAPKHIGQLPDPAGSSLERIKRRLFPNVNKHAYRHAKITHRGRVAHSKERDTMFLQHGPNKYAMLRCSEQLDEWLVHPDTQQWSCKQVVLLFASVVHRILASAVNIRKTQSDLFEEVRNASASEITADVVLATSQAWQDACQSVDDATINSRLDVPSLDLAVASLTQDQQQQLVTALKTSKTWILREVAPKHIGQLPDPAGSSLERIKRRLFPNVNKPRISDTRRSLTEEESRIQREEIQLILQYGPNKYTMLRCSEKLDEWLVHPDTQQWSCKQVVLLFASVVRRISDSAVNIRKTQSDLFEEVRTASTFEITADVVLATSQAWQDACQSVDDATISSRLDVPSLDLAVASLAQNQQQQLVTALRTSNAGMLREVAPKHICHLPDPAGSSLERIKRRLFPNVNKPRTKERRPLTEEESRIQRDEIQLILQHGPNKYAMMRCSEKLDEWMVHPDTQQWSCKQVVLLFASVVCRVIGNSAAFQHTQSTV
ncbi:hypothetical protein BC831DRAFT_55453 [Entophlyctis helioformis]|nr:hypothetical protein BC831DRAFT_55453 [Entophlyctis helioformis]